MVRVRFIILIVALIMGSSCTSWKKFWDLDALGFGSSLIGALSVAGTTPVSGSTNVDNLNDVMITFSSVISLSAVTHNSTLGACVGNVQISYNDFKTCQKITSKSLSTDGKTLTLVQPGLARGVTAKIRIKSGFAAVSGATVSPDFTSTGFTIANPPCGASNCYTNAAMPSATGAGSNASVIPAGTFRDYVLITVGAGTLINIYDPSTGLFVLGTTLNAGFVHPLAAGLGSHMFRPTTGVYADKLVYIPANGSGNFYVFDPLTITYSGALAIGATVGTGSHSFQLYEGSDAGKFVTILGGTLNSQLFNPATGTYAAGLSTTGSVVAVGADSFYSATGPNPGYVVRHAGGSTNFSFYDTAGPAYAASLPSNLTYSSGSSHFYLETGPFAGHLLITGSQSTTNDTDLMNLQTNAFVAAATTPNATVNWATGHMAMPITYGANAGKLFVAIGGASTNIFDPTAMVFNAATALPVSCGASAFAFPIETGIYTGAIAMVCGGNYIIYFP